MVDHAGPQQARRRVRSVDRPLDDDPAARLEQPVDRAAQLTGRNAAHRSEGDRDRGRAIGQKVLDIFGESHRRRSIEPPAGHRRSGRQIRRDDDE